MLWSIDCCQNRVSTNQYYLTVSRVQVSTHRGREFFLSCPLTSYYFSNDRGLKLIFLKCIMHALWAALLKFGFQTDLTITAVAFDFSHHGHALVTLYLQFLCPDWSKIDGWVQVENLVSSCGFFNCLFPLDVQNEIQLLSTFSCYSWLVCLLGFWLRSAPLVKVIGNPISDGIVFVFHVTWCVRGLKSLKRFRPYLKAFRSCILTGKPE